MRIGKPLPERRADEPFDSALEWDRDGQYFHYGMRWVHALAHAAIVLERPVLRRWARELLVTQHRAFAHGRSGARRMTWKMSIDLSRALVPSMGQHDALDGLVASARLVDDGRRAGEDPALGAAVTSALNDFASMIDRDALVTTDPLGIGALLEDAARLGRVAVAIPPIGIVDLLLGAADGLGEFVASGAMRGSSSHRLAFRELGLAIGLHAVAALESDAGLLAPRTRRALDVVNGFAGVGRTITRFWAAPRGRDAIEHAGHVDIDEVMLATALLGE